MLTCVIHNLPFSVHQYVARTWHHQQVWSWVQTSQTVIHTREIVHGLSQHLRATKYSSTLLILPLKVTPTATMTI